MGKTEVTGKQIKDSSVDLTVDVTGVLPVANGGSGSNTIALNNVVLGNGNGAVQTVAPGASGNVLRSNGTTWASSSLAQSDVSGLTTALSGKEPIINGGSTGQYWRGDKTWQTLNKTAVGLENVDNTSDANKPISTSTQTALNSKESTANKGVANGYASLDGGGKVPITQLPSSIMEYQGTWNATTNSPSLVDGTGNTGDVYRVSVAGTRNFGSGSITLRVGDYVIYNGSVWQKSATTDAVSTVAGLTGDVSASSLRSALGSGTANSSTFLRGDGAWATTSGISRSVQTITSSTTLANTQNTDYVYLCQIPSTISVDANTISYVNGDYGPSSMIEYGSISSSVTWPLAISNTTVKFGNSAFGPGMTYSNAPSELSFGTSDFTIEFWIYPNTSDYARVVWDVRGNSPSNISPMIFRNSTGSMVYAVANTALITGGNAAINTWSHIAVSRSSGTTRLFVNGTLAGSVADSNNYTQGSAGIAKGFYSNSRQGWGLVEFSASGFYDDLRISNIARYSSAFTAPTTPLFVPGLSVTLPTAVGNTSVYHIKSINSFSGASLTILTTSSQKIEGVTSWILQPSESVSLISDNSNWRIF